MTQGKTHMPEQPNLDPQCTPALVPPRLSRWLLLGLFLLACAVYANSLNNSFAFDDVAIVQNNEHVLNHEWITVWTDSYWPRQNGMIPDALFRPLTIWSYIANDALTPNLDWPYHLVNVLLHALTTVLAAMLTWRLIGNRAVAVVTGILFAVHPIHTEAIANVVGRAELLASVWTLLALLIYLPDMPLMNEGAPPRRSVFHGWLVALCFFAAILCKETPVTLLPALLFIDLWRWTRFSKEGRMPVWRWILNRSWRYYLPMTLFFGIYLKMRIDACGLMSPAKMTSEVVNPLVNATITERLVTPFMLLAKYVTLVFWPVHLAADYSMPSLMPTSNLTQPLVAGGILGCMLTGIIIWRIRRQAPQVILILGLFLLSYALVANVLRIGTIFGERLFYFPSLFFIMLLAWAAVAAIQNMMAVNSALSSQTDTPIRSESRDSVLSYASPDGAHHAYRYAVAAIAVALLVAMTAAMSYRTYVRNTDWKNNMTVAISAGRDNVDSGKACAWAASILLGSDHPEYAPFAVTLLEYAIDVTPEYADAYWSLAKYYAKQNQLAKSIIYLTRAAQLQPGDHWTRMAMVGAIADFKTHSPDEYMPLLEANFNEHPDSAPAALAIAMAYHGQAKYDKAGEYARKAIALGSHPSEDGTSKCYYEALAELGAILFDSGDQAEGLNEFRRYTASVPRSVDVRCDIAKMFLAADTKAHPEYIVEAQYNVNKAEQLDPGNARVRDLRGQIAREMHEAQQAHLAAADSPGGAPLANAAPAQQATPKSSPDAK